MSSLRTERTRNLELGRAIRNADPGTLPAPAKFVGAVTTGGTLPTCVPCYYTVNPVQLGGTEQEGGLPANLIDATRTVPVAFLGPKAPSLGDLATIVSAGGRWVADQSGASEKQICNNCGYVCHACGGVYLANGSITDANGTWPISFGFVDADGSTGWGTGSIQSPGASIKCVYSGGKQCTSSSSGYKYAYIFACHGTSVYLQVLAFTFSCGTCANDPTIFGFISVDTTDSTCLGTHGTFLSKSTLTPTCTQTALQASFTLGPIQCSYDGNVYTLDAPSSSVSVSFDIISPSATPMCRCGQLCAVCPDVYLPGNVCVTDANGTWVLTQTFVGYNPDGLTPKAAWVSSSSSAPGGVISKPIATLDCHTSCTGTQSGPLSYQLELVCDNTGMHLYRYGYVYMYLGAGSSWVICDGTQDNALVYLNYLDVVNIDPELSLCYSRWSSSVDFSACSFPWTGNLTLAATDPWGSNVTVQLLTLPIELRNCCPSGTACGNLILQYSGGSCMPFCNDPTTITPPTITVTLNGQSVSPISGPDASGNVTFPTKCQAGPYTISSTSIRDCLANSYTTTFQNVCKDNVLSYGGPMCPLYITDSNGTWPLVPFPYGNFSPYLFVANAVAPSLPIIETLVTDDTFWCKIICDAPTCSTCPECAVSGSYVFCGCGYTATKTHVSTSNGPVHYQYFGSYDPQGRPNTIYISVTYPTACGVSWDFGGIPGFNYGNFGFCCTEDYQGNPIPNSCPHAGPDWHLVGDGGSGCKSINLPDQNCMQTAGYGSPVFATINTTLAVPVITCEGNTLMFMFAPPEGYTFGFSAPQNSPCGILTGCGSILPPPPGGPAVMISC